MLRAPCSRSRFHLLTRRESAVGQIYALEIDKGGTKLRPYGDRTPTPASHDRKILFGARHLQDLCERLGKVTGRPVVDKTGLDGDYRIELAHLPLRRGYRAIQPTLHPILSRPCAIN